MTKHLKRIIGSYIFVCFLLCCLLMLVAGAVTAKQRSDYNSRFTEYAMASLYSDNKEISLRVSDKSYILKKDIPGKAKRYGNIIYFTPFSCPYFFLQCIME